MIPEPQRAMYSVPSLTTMPPAPDSPEIVVTAVPSALRTMTDESLEPPVMKTWPLAASLAM